MRSAPGSLLFYAGIAGATVVMAGAFGAHALGKILPPDRLQIFDTAVRYQAYHAVALLALSALTARMEKKSLLLAGRFFLAGIILFSGSLYFLACRSLLKMEEYTWTGLITPFGGACFIAGWIILAFVAWNDTINKN